MDDHSMGLDEQGRPLPMTSAQVKAYVAGILDDPTSTVVAVVFERGGEIAVSVYGPPSRTLVDYMEAATRGLRRALRG